MSSNSTDDAWIIGVMLSILAAIMNNVGVNFQKLYFSNKLVHIWLVGLLAIAVGSVLDVMALSFAPQSVLAPLGSLTILSNTIIAPVLHGEKLNNRSLFFSLLSFFGCILSVSAASHQAHWYEMSGLISLLTSVQFESYVLVMFLILLALYYLMDHLDNVIPAMISGVMGAFSVTLAKLLSNIYKLDSPDHVFVGILVTLQILSVALQLGWMNIALSLAPALIVVPVFTSSWIINTTIAGGVLYQEFDSFTIPQLLLFPLGVCLCVIGILGLIDTKP